MKVAHLHNFTYSADGATITATCGKTGCDLTESKATLTIAKPTLTTYGQTGDGISAEATITDDNNIKGDAAVTYAKDGQVLGAAPTDAGTYTASITLGDATASVEYTIAKAEPTAVAPTASATYGQALADVTLENPSGNTPGTWAWVDDSQSVGNAGTEAKNFKANFTPTDTANYSPEGYDAAKAACVTK